MPYVDSDDVFLQIGRISHFLWRAFSGEAILSHGCQSLAMMYMTAEVSSMDTIWEVRWSEHRARAGVTNKMPRTMLQRLKYSWFKQKSLTKLWNLRAFTVCSASKSCRASCKSHRKLLTPIFPAESRKPMSQRSVGIILFLYLKSQSTQPKTKLGSEEVLPTSSKWISSW